MKQAAAVVLVFALFAAMVAARQAQTNAPPQTPRPAAAKREPQMAPGGKWRVHDESRPRPPSVTPATGVPAETPGRPPSDAVVLFDGKDLSHWTAFVKNQFAEPQWKVENGYMEVVPGTGHLVSKEKFGDAQYHIEWAAPAEVKGSGQGRGNGGVFLMRRYEVQVLDSWQNQTYADGQAAAVYGQYPPLVNASRKPGEWQSYDVIFEAPRFEGEQQVKPAYLTLIHNGVVVQSHVELAGQLTSPRAGAGQREVEDSLMLQNHSGNLVRYRNIWVRKLKPYDEP